MPRKIWRSTEFGAPDTHDSVYCYTSSILHAHNLPYFICLSPLKNQQQPYVSLLYSFVKIAAWA